jgi:hypothetical protein
MPQEKRLLKPLLPVASRHRDFTPGEGIDTRVIHAGGKGTGSGGEVLNLVHPQIVAFEKKGQLHHVIKGTPGMPRHQVGNHVLLSAQPSTFVPEAGEKALERPLARLAHQIGDRVHRVFGSNLEESTHMVGEEFAQVYRLTLKEVIPDTRRNGHMLYSRNRSHPPEERCCPPVVSD